DRFKKLLKLLSKKNIKNTEFKSFIEEQSFSANRVKVELRNVTDNTMRRIRHSENSFPESLLMISEETYANLDKDQETFEQVEILVRQLADFLVQKNLVAPLQEKMLEIGKKLDNISSRSQEYVKWLSFHLVGEEEENEVINEKQINDDPKRLTQNLKDELDYISEQQRLLTAHISELKTELDNSLSIDNFMRSIKEMRQYVRKMEQKERMHQFRTFIYSNRKRFRETIDAVLFSKSKKIVERHSKTQPNTPATTQDFLMLRKSVAPDASQIKEIPFYYQQLFSRKQYYLNELWTGRDQEIQTAKEAYEDYSSGFHGGLLITGDRFSGKSFFSQYIAKMLAKEGKVYTLYAPYAGSLSTAHFKSQLQKATDIYGSSDEIFDKIPAKSILIIDDLELWWENTENGNRVIDQLLFLMERYSSKCFFIVGLNSVAHQKMRENRNLDAIFLRIIRMSPMDSQSIRDAILKRHRSSNLTYKISGSGPATGKSIRDAQLFNAVFYFSGGNIGLALKAWLGAVVSTDQDSITLKEPKTPDLSQFSTVEQDWIDLIEQVLLHKRLTFSRMIRVSGESQANVLKRINMLKRAGILTEQNDGVYEIDSYLYYWIQKILRKKN
ncbi:MAG TPA: ATP-binding protein, partial [Bacteroidales bacterium]|nr:ATP-binding protein [Bacteroidales bacterium]